MEKLIRDMFAKRVERLISTSSEELVATQKFIYEMDEKGKGDIKQMLIELRAIVSEEIPLTENSELFTLLNFIDRKLEWI